MNTQNAAAPLNFDQMIAAAKSAFAPLSSFGLTLSQSEDVIGVCQCDKATTEQQIAEALSAAGLGENERSISFSGRDFGYQVTVYAFSVNR